jgi:hypothetical protein
MKDSQLITCNKCGWVHFGVTRAHAEAEVKKFNEYYETCDQETKDSFGGRPSRIDRDYDRCFVCGPGATFRPFEEGDCPDGCTIQGAIYERKESETEQE